jgi:propionyl-CoA synthetase
VPIDLVAGRDVDYATLRALHIDARVAVTWLESNEASYILYTSGTTGKPKGVQRDVGGHAVALVASMKYNFFARPGETFFATSDIGWVVGHSYIVYGPLIAGMATIMYEGLPSRPDGGTWWSIVEKYQVTRMFSAPTAMRVLRKQPPQLMRDHDLSSLKALHLAGEPLDATTCAWIAGELGVPIIANYWQTETGWPILSIAKGIEDKPTKLGSPGGAMYGYKVGLLNEATGQACGPNEKGGRRHRGPAAARLHADGVWRRRPVCQHLLVHLQWQTGVFDLRLGPIADGYYFILGRTDDIINVAAHRLCAREIEESISSHANVSEVAVVGVEDQLKG